MKKAIPTDSAADALDAGCLAQGLDARELLDRPGAGTRACRAGLV